MDANTTIVIKAEIVGKGVIFPCPFSGAAHFDGRFPPEGYVTPDPLPAARLGTTVDYTFIPEKGWRVSQVYLRDINQKEGRTPDYKYGSQMSIDSIRTMKGGDNMPDGTPRFHLSIGPAGVAHVDTIEHILRVVFVPIDAAPPAYTGPTLEEMDVKAEITAIKARLTKAGL